MSYAGVDWSGTPHPQEPLVDIDLYIPCAVRADDVEAVDAWLAALRQELGRPVTYEFHGHRCALDVQLRVAEYALETCQVVTTLFDKRRLAEDMGAVVFGRPVLLAPATGRLVLDRMLEDGPLRRIWCDVDIASDRRKTFNTEISRRARALWPMSPDVKHYPSDKSSLIQLADMVAYVLQREARAIPQSAELRKCAARFWRKSGNQIRWGRGDDLRPYL